MDFSPNNTTAYIVVGILTSVTTIIVAKLNTKYSKRVKPSHSAQSGYSEWVAYLEREITNLKEDNKALNKRIDELGEKLYEKEGLIARMRSKLLEFSRKYNEDVSSII